MSNPEEWLKTNTGEIVEEELKRRPDDSPWNLNTEHIALDFKPRPDPVKERQFHKDEIDAIYDQLMTLQAQAIRAQNHYILYLEGR